MELAAEYGLAVVEDASESLGSRYKGRMCGHLAPISCLSFNGNKIVTTGGGGAIMTDDDEIARQARYLTTQAKEDGVEYIHNSVGYNYRMNNVLAAIGLAQLENLDERLAIKRANFARYEEALGPSRLLGQPAWSDVEPLVLRPPVRQRRHEARAPGGLHSGRRSRSARSGISTTCRSRIGRCRRTASRAPPASMTPCSTCHARSR